MEVLLVRALGIAEMAVKVDVAIGVVMNRNGADRFVDNYLMNSLDGRQGIADLFQRGGIPFGRRYTDSQSSLGVMGDLCAMPHGNLIGPRAGGFGRRCRGFLRFGLVLGTRLRHRILHLLGGLRH